MSDTPEQTRPSGPATYWLRPKSNRVLIAVLIAAGSACLVHLLFGEKPWDGDLDFSQEAGERTRTHAYAVKGLWIAASINLGLIATALAAWRFRPGEMCDLRRSRAARTGPSIQPIEKPVLIILVAAAVGLSAILMWPRLTLSLWGDEEATARRYVVGNAVRRDDGTLRLIPPSWQRAAWNWDNGTNSHVLFNLLARLSHGPGDDSGEFSTRFHFDERGIRLPSFLATLVMISAAAWLTWILGFPRGSPLVAFLLAFHPWIIRYGTEARGYALMMAFAPMAIGFLVKALRSERSLFWWIAFGFCEFLLLYSNLTSVYFLVPLNLAALWLAWSPWEPGHRNPFRVADVWRLAGANLLGAAVFLQLMLPNLLQFRRWVERTGRLGKEKFDPSWIENTVAYYASGMPWHDWDAKNPRNLTLENALIDQPAVGWLTIGFSGLLFLAGLAALLLRKRQRSLLVPLLLPVPLMILGAIRTKTLLYPWYAIGFLPLALVVVGAGFGFLALFLRRLPPPAAIPAAIGLALAALIPFSILSAPQRFLNRFHSVEPLAESVRSTRNVINPFHPDIDGTLTLGFVHATQLYDPAMTLARNDDQFIAAVHEAETSGKTLWVNAANLNLGRPVFPRAFELLDNREIFKEPEVLWGLQKPCSRYLFRYIPGGLAKAGLPDDPE